METNPNRTSVQLDRVIVELSQPLANRPDVLVVTTSDGRRAILGDRGGYNADELVAIGHRLEVGAGVAT